jgi:hypothetical protein
VGIWIVSRNPAAGVYAASRRFVPPKSIPIENESEVMAG